MDGNSVIIIYFFKGWFNDLWSYNSSVINRYWVIYKVLEYDCGCSFVLFLRYIDWREMIGCIIIKVSNYDYK